MFSWKEITQRTNFDGKYSKIFNGHTKDLIPAKIFSIPPSICWTCQFFLTPFILLFVLPFCPQVCSNSLHGIGGRLHSAYPSFQMFSTRSNWDCDSLSLVICFFFIQCLPTKKPRVVSPTLSGCALLLCGALSWAPLTRAKFRVVLAELACALFSQSLAPDC